jgi:hypothetical protein
LFIYYVKNRLGGYNEAVMALSPSARGRPKKFGRPARSVTLTLPHDVIERLGDLNADLGRAVVGLVERVRGKVRPRPPAEVATYGGHSVILVAPVRAWRAVPGVQLVPVSDGRALIALDHPHGIPQLELDLRDALDKRTVKGRDRLVLEAVAAILKDARYSHGFTVHERSIIVFEARRRRQHPES